MIKKKSNVQNLVIIILCVLLVISIGFGVTYSYYNGKSNLVKGTITTANLSIGLQGDDGSGQTTEFSISAPLNDQFLVPGNNLNNVELNLINKCNQKTFMVVVYSLTAFKNDTREDVTPYLANMPAISFQQNAYDKNTWKDIRYQCKNKNASYTCLVGVNPFDPKTSDNGYSIKVLKSDSIKIPTEWNDILQNCSVTISITAYAIQADNVEIDYPNVNSADEQTKAQAIAEATLKICKVDASSN